MGTGHKKRSLISRGRRRAKRAKTFASEEKAKAHAQKEGIKNFEVVRLSTGLSRKFKIVSK